MLPSHRYRLLPEAELASHSRLLPEAELPSHSRLLPAASCTAIAVHIADVAFPISLARDANATSARSQPVS